jgi:TolB protein
VRPDGSELTQLTFNESTDDFPGVSADGEKLVFITDREEEFSDQIYVMAPDGSGQQRIRGDVLTYGDSARLSPDGSLVAFSAYDESFDLIVVQLLDLNTGAINVVNEGSGRDEQWNPTFSPDGSQISWSVHYADDHVQIVVVNIDGSDPVEVTGDGVHYYPAWSPNGDRILYADDDGGIFSMNPDGTDPVRLADGNWAMWSPDGEYIVYTSYENENGLEQLYIMAADGSGQTRIVESFAKDVLPVWGPFGGRGGGGF